MQRNGSKLTAPIHPESGDASWDGSLYDLNNVQADSLRGMWIRDVLISRIAFEEMVSGKLPPWASENEKILLRQAVDIWWLEAGK